MIKKGTIMYRNYDSIFSFCKLIKIMIVERETQNINTASEKLLFFLTIDIHVSTVRKQKVGMHFVFYILQRKKINLQSVYFACIYLHDVFTIQTSSKRKRNSCTMLFFFLITVLLFAHTRMKIYRFENCF